MVRLSRYIVLMIMIANLVMGCNRKPVISVDQNQKNPYKENMINANKYIESAEETQIMSYIQRKGWEMNQLRNGEWVEEYQVGQGRQISFEDTVTLTYKVSALNGKSFYGEEEETIIVGQHKPTVGIDRAVMELKKGSKAHVVLPSSLGYGVVGDGDQIPSRAVLIYDLEIKELK